MNPNSQQPKFPSRDFLADIFEKSTPQEFFPGYTAFGATTKVQTSPQFNELFTKLSLLDMELVNTTRRFLAVMSTATSDQQWTAFRDQYAEVVQQLNNQRLEALGLKNVKALCEHESSSTNGQSTKPCHFVEGYHFLYYQLVDERHGRVEYNAAQQTAFLTLKAAITEVVKNAKITDTEQLLGTISVGVSEHMQVDPVGIMTLKSALLPDVTPADFVVVVELQPSGFKDVRMFLSVDQAVPKEMETEVVTIELPPSGFCFLNGKSFFSDSAQRKTQRVRELKFE